jgi:Phage portal protein, SPP1 Gp6-like
VTLSTIPWDTAALGDPTRLYVPDLDVDEQADLDELWAQLRARTPRNLLRRAYYDGKNAWRTLGIAFPPYLANRVAVVLGWSAKAVDVLNRRCRLEGFYVPGMESSSLGVDALWEDNLLASEASQAGVSSLIHSVSFLVVTQGDTAAGEPPVLIAAKDALSGTGAWDARRRALRSFLSVIDTDEDGRPAELVLYRDGVTVEVTRDDDGWEVERSTHRFGVPVEPLPYKPRLGRPFGSSRISRPVMSLHDGALRTVLRSEVNAELYSVAQRVLLGADEKAFQTADGHHSGVWQSVLGRVWAIPDDEDAANPRADIKEYSAASQEPHISQLRAWAQLFAGETSIPLASLGISGEANPTSEGAYDAGREDLYAEAEGTQDDWSPFWRRTMLRALAMLNGWDEVPEEARRLAPKWRDVRTPSRAAAADAAAKTLAQFPWLAESELGLELYGFDESFVQRADAERRRAASRQAIAALGAVGP